jgi:hypothetical protein
MYFNFEAAWCTLVGEDTDDDHGLAFKLVSTLGN